MSTFVLGVFGSGSLAYGVTRQPFSLRRASERKSSFAFEPWYGVKALDRKKPPRRPDIHLAKDLLVCLALSLGGIRPVL